MNRGRLFLTALRIGLLLTDEYRELNRALHSSNPNYGTSGAKYVGMVAQVIKQLGSQDVLDYGCGKRLLEEALGFSITNYDPCIEGLDRPPEPHDIVTCTDVLEHIEPACLDDVLADVRRCTKKLAFLTIATGPAKKYLADGRNAHLIQEDARWWIPKLWNAGFTLHQFNNLGAELVLIVG